MAGELKVPDIVKIPVVQIVGNDWNPNVMKEEEFDSLVDSMQQTGFVENVQLVPIELLPASFREQHKAAKYVMIGGEHRWRAASVIDMDASINAVIWSREDIENIIGGKVEVVDEKIMRAMLMAWTGRMNLVRGNMDVRKTTAMYGMIKNAIGGDEARRQMGLSSDKAFAKMIKDAKKVLPPAVGEKLEQMAGEIDNEEGLTAAVQTLMQKYGRDLEHGFMFFALGGQTHLMIEMNGKLKAIMDVVADYCRTHEVDMARVVGLAIQQGWTKIEHAGEQVAPGVIDDHEEASKDGV